MAKHADRQSMIVTTSGASVTPWRFTLAMFTSRWFAIGLAVVDGCISYRGLRSWDVDIFPAATLALLIALLQGVVGMALTSGQPIGEEFTNRFFNDSGPMGMIRRSLGVFVCLIVLSLYLFDIASNFVAFHGTEFEPTANATIRAMLFLFAATFVTVADECFHVFSDILSTQADNNSSNYRSKTYDSQLRSRYQSHYMKTASTVADDLGKTHGANWRPE
ncbi:MAG: hypothetical protein F6K11_25375 [Leptolyngbya sp. SIO3F4]|nr:hypothetical protein [Leptolyngbya sp. SIO3F4]